MKTGFGEDKTRTVSSIVCKCAFFCTKRTVLTRETASFVLPKIHFGRTRQFF
jgi:hypothetical protein